MKKIRVFLISLLLLATFFPTSAASTNGKQIQNPEVSVYTSNRLFDVIEFDGICNMFFHFLYRTQQNTIVNPTKNVVKTELSLILFQDAHISINHGEINQHGTGLLILSRYTGEYDLDYDEHTLIIEGKALIVKVKMF